MPFHAPVKRTTRNSVTRSEPSELTWSRSSQRSKTRVRAAAGWGTRSAASRSANPAKRRRRRWVTAGPSGSGSGSRKADFGHGALRVVLQLEKLALLKVEHPRHDVGG